MCVEVGSIRIDCPEGQKSVLAPRTTNAGLDRGHKSDITNDSIPWMRTCVYIYKMWFIAFPYRSKEITRSHETGAVCSRVENTILLPRVQHGDIVWYYRLTVYIITLHNVLRLSLTMCTVVRSHVTSPCVLNRYVFRTRVVILLVNSIYVIFARYLHLPL